MSEYICPVHKTDDLVCGTAVRLEEKLLDDKIKALEGELHASDLELTASEAILQETRVDFYKKSDEAMILTARVRELEAFLKNAENASLKYYDEAKSLQSRILALESSNLAQKMALEMISNHEHLKTEETIKYPKGGCMKVVRGKESISYYQGEAELWKALYKKVKSRNKMLEHALKKYGSHFLQDCRKVQGGTVCSCGLDDLLNQPIIPVPTSRE